MNIQLVVYTHNDSVYNFSKMRTMIHIYSVQSLEININYFHVTNDLKIPCYTYIIFYVYYNSLRLLSFCVYIIIWFIYIYIYVYMVYLFESLCVRCYRKWSTYFVGSTGNLKVVKLAKISSH